MSSTKGARHPAGKARISGKRVKHPLLPTARSPFIAPNTAASRAALGGLALARIDDNVIAGETQTVPGAAADSKPSSTGVASKPIIQLFVFGSRGVGGANAVDSPAMLDLLDLVRQRHAVQIDHDAPFPDSLTMRSESQLNLRFAFEDVLGFARRLKLPGQNQIIMVQPFQDQQKKIVLIEDTNNRDMVRPSLRNDPYAVKIESGDAKNLFRHVAAFRKQFARLSNTIRHASCSLHMQAHLGKLFMLTQDGRSLVEAGGGATQLSSALESSAVEDSIIFDRRIGGMSAFRAFQRRVFQSGDDFYPLSSVAENLDDVQPQHILVGIMEGLRFELEIGPPASAPDGRSAKLSGLRVFQTIGSENRVGLATACPAHHIDWKLETAPELQTNEIPATIKDFLCCVTVVHPKNQGDFPTPIVRAGSSKEHRVKQLFGKTAWTVGFKGTQYRLELNLYHKFSKQHLGPDGLDDVLMGVSIWNSSWEEILRLPTGTSGRDLGVDWAKLFRPGINNGKNENGIVTFLQLVYRIIHLWDSVYEETLRPAAVFSNIPKPHAQYSKDTKSSQANLVPGHRVAQKASGSHNSGNDVDANNNNQSEEEDLLIFD